MRKRIRSNELWSGCSRGAESIEAASKRLDRPLIRGPIDASRPKPALKRADHRGGRRVVEAARLDAVAETRKIDLQGRDRITSHTGCERFAEAFARRHPETHTGFGQRPPGEALARVLFARGRDVGMGQNARRLDGVPPGHIPAECDDGRDLRGGNGGSPKSCPPLTISTPIEAEFRSVSPAQKERPA